jgi:nucleoside-diphosphate-sugar epimerase
VPDNQVYYVPLQFMKIFVTGGTGFIGSHFLNTVAAAGHDVLALKRPGSLPRIAVSNSVKWLDSEFDQVDFSAMSPVAGDCLIHFAAYGVSPQPCEWEHALAINVGKSVAMVKRASEAGLNRVIVCGTCMEYGSIADRYDFIPTDAPLTPRGAYASSKAAQSVALEGLAREKQLKLSILRPFTVYGEGQHPSNFWPSLRKAALSGEDFPMTTGEQIRDFTPVGLVASKFVQAALASPLAPGNPTVINIGTGKPQTLREFAESWWQRLDAKGKLLFGAIPQREGETMRYVPRI